MAVWEQQFDTQCRIRRAVIVHGAVQDIFWDEATGQTGVSIVDHLRNRLERLGYADVIRWDSHNGATVATDRDSTRKALSAMVHASVASAARFLTLARRSQGPWRLIRNLPMSLFSTPKSPCMLATTPVPRVDSPRSPTTRISNPRPAPSAGLGSESSR